jgi:HEPN domain-containing protein
VAFKLDPESEVNYRVRLAQRYLLDAEDAYKRGDYRGVVASSQLVAENAAKAVIAVYRVPSWTHDPSHELLELTTQMPRELEPLVLELAEIARSLAPEHGRAVYGEPSRGLTPWDIYSREDAESALNRARKALELALAILRELRAANRGS